MVKIRDEGRRFEQRADGKKRSGRSFFEGKEKGWSAKDERKDHRGSLYGNDVEGWIDQSIALYVATTATRAAAVTSRHPRPADRAEG